MQLHLEKLRAIRVEQKIAALSPLISLESIFTLNMIYQEHTGNPKILETKWHVR